MVRRGGEREPGNIAAPSVFEALAQVTAHHFLSVASSSTSLKTVKGPGNSGFGVYSNESMSSETT